jgi:4-hydroxy-tetrahydrodipicolinate reductase
MGLMKVGFFGFGRAGQEIVREFLKEDGFEVVWVIRQSEKDKKKFASRLLGFESDQGQIFSAKDATEKFFIKNPVDIIVDFSSQGGLKEYAMCAKQGVKIISAISNYEQEQIVLLNELSQETAVLYSPNITLGINFLLVASQLLYKIAPHADVEIVEEHFRQKKDVSGTALKIADSLGLDKKLHVNSIRVGGIVGRHEVIFGLPNQAIRLVHESINRKAFGQGAIFVARWIISKPKGFYHMEEIITEMIKNNLPVY